jgi:hypothetical protein
MQAWQHGQVGDHEARVRLGLRVALRYVGESPALWIPLGMMVLVARCRSTSRCCCRCWRARRGAARGHLCRADRGDGRRLGGRRPGHRRAAACRRASSSSPPRASAPWSWWRPRCRRLRPDPAGTDGDPWAAIDDAPQSLEPLLALHERDCANGPARRAVAAGLPEAARQAATSRTEPSPPPGLDLFGERLSNASPKIVDTGTGHCAEHKRISVAAGLSVWIINALYRFGVRGDRERDDEDRARTFFDEHG